MKNHIFLSHLFGAIINGLGRKGAHLPHKSYVASNQKKKIYIIQQVKRLLKVLDDEHGDGRELLQKFYAMLNEYYSPQKVFQLIPPKEFHEGNRGRGENVFHSAFQKFNGQVLLTQNSISVGHKIREVEFKCACGVGPINGYYVSQNARMIDMVKK